jgi:hypothetical protein
MTWGNKRFPGYFCDLLKADLKEKKEQPMLCEGEFLAMGRCKQGLCREIRGVSLLLSWTISSVCYGNIWDSGLSWSHFRWDCFRSKGCSQDGRGSSMECLFCKLVGLVYDTGITYTSSKVINLWMECESLDLKLRRWYFLGSCSLQSKTRKGST